MNAGRLCRLAVRTKEAEEPWLEQISTATIRETEDLLEIEYAELREDGTTVPVAVRVSEKRIDIDRGAPLYTRMSFEPGNVTKTIYPTMAGDWQLYLHTTRLVRLQRENRTEIRLYYRLYPDEAALVAGEGIAHQVRFVLFRDDAEHIR